MSSDVDVEDDRPTGPSQITLRWSDDGEWWIARDEETGVTTQGHTRQEALANLDEAVAGYHGAGESPSEDQLREFGIDPEDNTSGSLDDSEMFE